MLVWLSVLTKVTDEFRRSLIQDYVRMDDFRYSRHSEYKQPNTTQEIPTEYISS